MQLCHEMTWSIKKRKSNMFESRKGAFALKCWIWSLYLLNSFCFSFFFREIWNSQMGKDLTNLQLQTLDTSAIKQYKRAIYPILKAQRFCQVRQWWWCHSVCCPLPSERGRRSYGLILKEVPVLGNSETSCCILFQ